MKRNDVIKFLRPWMAVAALSVAGMVVAQAHGDNRGRHGEGRGRGD